MSENDVLGDALAEVAGPFKDLMDKLAGPEGTLWLGGLKKFLRKEDPWSEAGKGKKRKPRQKSAITHVIDLDATPTVPDRWRIAEPERQIVSRATGSFTWDPTKIGLHLEPEQKEGGALKGTELQTRIKDKPVLPANVLDYLIAHPDLIPESWKKDAAGNTRYIYFWGTIYRRSDGRLYVRSLYWRGGQWHWDWSYDWLGRDFGDRRPAALLAS